MIYTSLTFHRFIKAFVAWFNFIRFIEVRSWLCLNTGFLFKIHHHCQSQCVQFYFCYYCIKFGFIHFHCVSQFGAVCFHTFSFVFMVGVISGLWGEFVAGFVNAFYIEHHPWKMLRNTVTTLKWPNLQKNSFLLLEVWRLNMKYEEKYPSYVGKKHISAIIYILVNSSERFPVISSFLKFLYPSKWNWINLIWDSVRLKIIIRIFRLHKWFNKVTYCCTRSILCIHGFKNLFSKYPNLYNHTQNRLDSISSRMEDEILSVDLFNSWLLFHCLVFFLSYSAGPQKCSACIKEEIFEEPTSILKQGCVSVRYKWDQSIKWTWIIYQNHFVH